MSLTYWFPFKKQNTVHTADVRYTHPYDNTTVPSLSVIWLRLSWLCVPLHMTTMSHVMLYTSSD